jgi:hypothetical protein
MVGDVHRGVDEKQRAALYTQHIATGIHYCNYHYLESDFSSSRQRTRWSEVCPGVWMRWSVAPSTFNT